MSKSIIGSMQEANVFLRLTAFLVVFFFLFTFYSPIVLAANNALQSKPSKHPFNNDYSNLLQEFKQRLGRQKKHMSGIEAPSWIGRFFSDDVSMMTQEMDEMLSMKRDLLEMDKAAMVAFAQDKVHLDKHHMSGVVMQRHEDAVAAYQQKFASMMEMMDGMNQAESDSEQRDAVDTMHEFMQKNQFKRSHKPFDPKKLPFRSLKNNARKPFTTKAELSSLFTPAPVQVAANGIVPGLLAQSSELGLEITPEDLAETLEVQFTPAIKALAEELGKDPIAIYTWVYNNIRFIPSYGSIQGADMTLQNKRGNAIDTASLLIALLRYSGTPARYVYSTVEMPIDKVMNWVGGVTVPEAALQLLGQGGIPVTGLKLNGKFVAARIEHVWVEGFVDFEPSMGVRNLKPDTWVPMDASYKQYVFTEGMDLSEVPFDAAAFEQAIIDGTEVNEEEGSVKGFPQDAITEQLQAYQSQVDAFIASQNPDATVGDVIGTNILKVIQRGPLDVGQPYKLYIIGNRFTEVPDNLRYKFIFTLRDEFGSEVYSINKNTVELAGKKLAHSFSPASQGDIDILNSYLPESHEDGRSVDLSELPESLPGYLIHLTGELVLDGQAIVQGGDFVMGSELEMEAGFSSPGSQFKLKRNKWIVGEYHAIGLNLQGISDNQIQLLKYKVEKQKKIFEDRGISDLSQHDLVGNLLYSIMLAYFSISDVYNEITAKSAGIVMYRQPSYGFFSTSIQTSYQFGIPKNVSQPGLLMDIDGALTSIISKNNSSDEKVSFYRQTGIRLSAMEHAIPELLFVNDKNPVEGISAVKALSIALQQGQKIYSITKINFHVILPKLRIDLDIINDIKNAINEEMEVIVSEENIYFNGWGGVGYIVIDPRTGAGAYKISGGFNGGAIKQGNTFAAFGSLLISLGFFHKVHGLQAYAWILFLLGTVVSIAAIRSAENFYDRASTAALITTFILLSLALVAPQRAVIAVVAIDAILAGVSNILKEHYPIPEEQQ